jgi:hypothetical protein
MVSKLLGTPLGWSMNSIDADNFLLEKIQHKLTMQLLEMEVPVVMEPPKMVELSGVVV